jgi:hypothetical protein
MMQWITAHQVLLIAMWPLLTAVVSLFYKQLDAIPRVHAALSVLTALGIDLPKLWEALGRVITGNPPASGGPGTGGKTTEEKAKETMTFPKKPAVMRIAQALAMALFCAFVPIATGTVLAVSLAGCSMLPNAVTIASQLATYVNAFVSMAQTVWAQIAPLLGSNQAADTAAFNDAIVVLQNADALMMDTAQAVQAGKTGNLPQAIQAVQDAVARVMAIITQFRSSTPAAGYATEDHMGKLQHMAATIQHWQVQQ